MTRPFRLGNVGLDQLRRELVTPAEDVHQDEIAYLTPGQAVQAIDQASRRVRGARRDQPRRPAERGGPPSAPRPVRVPLPEDLDQAEIVPLPGDQVRQRSLAGIVRPHRLPWVAQEMDLADCPCSCSRTVACMWHQATLGGPRPYARD